MVRKFRVGLALQARVQRRMRSFAHLLNARWRATACRHGAVCKLALRGRQAMRLQELPQQRVVSVLLRQQVCGSARMLTALRARRAPQDGRRQGAHGRPAVCVSAGLWL